MSQLNIPHVKCDLCKDIKQLVEGYPKDWVAVYRKADNVESKSIKNTAIDVCGMCASIISTGVTKKQEAAKQEVDRVKTIEKMDEKIENENN